MPVTPRPILLAVSVGAPVEQTSSPVASLIVRPQRWKIVDRAGVTWYGDDPEQLERWVAAGCADGQCGER